MLNRIRNLVEMAQWFRSLLTRHLININIPSTCIVFQEYILKYACLGSNFYSIKSTKFIAVEA